MWALQKTIKFCFQWEAHIMISFLNCEPSDLRNFTKTHCGGGTTHFNSRGLSKCYVHSKCSYKVLLSLRGANLWPQFRL